MSRGWGRLESTGKRGETLLCRRGSEPGGFSVGWCPGGGFALPSPLHGSVFAPYSPFAAFGVEHPAFGHKAATRPLWALTGAFVVGAWPGRDAGLGVGLVLAYGAVFRKQRHQG